MGFFYSFNYWLFMLPAMILMMIAQWWVNSTYRKWGNIANQMEISGGEAAQRLLRSGGLHEVRLEGASGRLSDHYDPRSQTLRLSPSVAQGRSVASLAIAAHEIGHAIQHSGGYFLLQLRNTMVPVVNFGSMAGWFLIMIGLFLGSTNIAWLGVFAFSLGAVFALATLPIELNASARARELLDHSGLVRTESERRGVRSMLNAAAFTYIAGLAAALFQLLYYVSLVASLGGRRRR